MTARATLPGGAAPARRTRPPVFGTASVARLLGVPPARVRALARAALCRPGRRGRAYAFSFQDVVLLRTALALRRQHVSPQRVRQAVGALTRQLPGRPLSGVRLYADGGEVLVRDRRRAWDLRTGQAVFVFDVDDLARRARVVPVAKERPAAPAPVLPPATAADWFARGLALEPDDPRAARLAYRRVLELDPEHSDAYINLGRLAHGDGARAEAIRCYREALRRAPHDPIAHYNLALACEEDGDPEAAMRHYHQALARAPTFADAHFNLARLLEHLGRARDALSHLRAYQQLIDAEA